MAEEDKYKLAPEAYQAQPEAAPEYKLAPDSYQEQPEAAGPRYMEAAKSGATSTLQTSSDILNKFDIPAKGMMGVGANLAKGLLNKVLPAIGPSKDFQPQGAAEYATQFGTGLLTDIPAMVASSLITKAAAPLIRGVFPKIGTLGQQVAKNLEVATTSKELGLVNETKVAAENAYKSFFTKRVLEGAAENAVEGTVTTAAQSYAQGDTPGVTAIKSLLGGGVGAVAGGTFSAALARSGKSGFSNIAKGFSEKVFDDRTPGVVALEEMITKGQQQLDSDRSMERIFATKVDYPEVSNMSPGDFEARLVFQVVDKDGLVHAANNAADAKKIARQQVGTVRLGIKNDAGAIVPLNPRTTSTGPETFLPDPADQDAFFLLEKIRETQAFDPEKVYKGKTEKLTNIKQLEDAKQRLIFNSRKVSTEKIPDIYKQQTQGGAVENARLQAEKVFQMGKEGILPQDQVSIIAKAEFDNALEKQFVNRDGLHNVDEGTWRLGHEAANKIDQALGTNLSGAHLAILSGRTATKNLIQEFNTADAALIDSLAKTGLGVDREMASILRYIETDPETGLSGLNINASENPLNIRPPYDGPTLTPQQLDLFVQLRQRLDQKRARYAAEVGDIGQVPGYLPIREKELVVGQKKTVDSTLAPKAAQARESGYWDPTLHETDMTKILFGYNQEVGRAIGLKPAIDEGLKQAALLQLIGDANGLAFWKRQLADSFGLAKTRDLEDMFGQKVFKDLEPQLLKVISKASDPELMKSELLREISKAFYTNKVLLSAKNQVLQFFQPELVGFGEIGTYATKGRLRDAETDKAVNEMMKQAYHSSANDLGSFTSKTPTGKAARLIEGLNRPGKLLGGAVQNASEQQNRKAILGGAYMQWTDTFNEQGIAGLAPLLDRLLPAQSSAIQQTFKKQGQEAAKRHYAIITSDRANFSYDIINRPQALRNEVGNNIPFLTFGLNSLERLATDAKGGQIRQLARRFAPAIVASYAISLASNDKRTVDGMNPAMSALGVLAPNVNPAVSTAIETFQQRDLGQAGLKMLSNVTPSDQLLKIKENFDKNKWGENTLNQFGLKKKKPDWTDAIAKQLKKVIR